MKMAMGLLALLMASASAPVAGGELTSTGLVSRLDIVDWTGQFAVDLERSVTLWLWDRQTLQIDFLLSVGLLAHARDEIEDVETVQFSVRIPESWIYVNNQIAFMLGPDGAEPPEEADVDDCIIVLRLDWNINWIDVTDTDPCAGALSLAGRYEWFEPRGSGD